MEDLQEFQSNNAPTMSEANEQLLAAARTYVTDIFNTRLPGEIVFHNLEHTEDVVEACSIMAEHYNLEEEDRLILLLAAWFHDLGYLTGTAEGHEDVSIDMSRKFLESRHVDNNIIEKVISCIQATRMPQSPITQIEKILCDADLSHLAAEDFRARNMMLRQERENILGEKIPKKQWQKSNAAFLESHKYFTDFAKDNYEPRKQDHINDLRKKKGDKATDAKGPSVAFPYKSTNIVPDAKTDAKNTERGVQTMFRTTSKNHLDLSGMADSKAHILITVNSIILSVSVSFLIARLPFYPHFLIPSAILVLTCLVAVTFAILATRPLVSSGKFTEEDIRNKKTNLLFFGNFHKMELQDYQWGMNQMIRDKEYLYNTMIMDIYFIGVVLARKYRFLRISYTIFMYGLIVAVIAFAIAAALPDAAGGATGGESVPVIDY